MRSLRQTVNSESFPATGDWCRTGGGGFSVVVGGGGVVVGAADGSDDGDGRGGGGGGGGGGRSSSGLKISPTRRPLCTENPAS